MVTSASSVTASRAWLAVDLAQCVANPRKGVSSFLDCVYGVVCQGLSDVTLGGGGAPLVGVRVRPGVYRGQLPLAVCDGRRPPMCGSVAFRMSGTCGAKRNHRSHNTCTPQRDSENERNHE